PPSPPGWTGSRAPWCRRWRSPGAGSSRPAAAPPAPALPPRSRPPARPAPGTGAPRAGSRSAFGSGAGGPGRPCAPPSRHPAASLPQPRRGAEVAWTLLPALLLALLVWASFRALAPAATTSPLLLEGRELGGHWSFRYPGGVTTRDELRVPAGEQVTLRATVER